MRRWLDNWKRVGPILGAERVANLRKMDETESARIAVASLWPMARVGAGDSGEGLKTMKDALRRACRAAMTLTPLVEAASDLLRFFDALGRPACLIGGMVVARWGEPRVTQDVDVTVLAEFGEEAALVDALLSKYKSRGGDARTFPEINRMALLEAPNGVLVDVSFAAFPSNGKCSIAPPCGK